MLFSPRLPSPDSDAATLTELNQLHQVAITTRDTFLLAQVVGKYAALAAYRSTRPTTLRSAVSNPYENFVNVSAESQSLRLQMVMEQRSRIMSTISNIMKKVAESSDTIIANIK